MTQLVPIQIDADTIIYIEPADDIQVQPQPSNAPNQELTRADLDLGSKGATDKAARKAAEKALQRFEAMESTIKTYTQRTLNSFKDLAAAEVSKVQLEFGINLGGEAGVPYVTKGTAQCSLKITVECNFSNQKKN